MRERPVAVLGVILFVSVSTASFVGAVSASVIAAVLLAATAVVIIILRNKLGRSVAAVMATAALGLVIFSARAVYCAEPVSMLDGQSTFVTCRACEKPRVSDGRYIYEVKCTEIDADVSPGFKFLIYSGSDLELNYGDCFTARVHFFDNGNGYYADNIYISAYVDNYSGDRLTVIGNEDTLYGYAVRLREYMCSTVRRYASGDEAAIISGVTLGQTDDMSHELHDAIRACGLSHMTVVSGAHLSVIISLLSVVFRRFGRRLSAAMCMPAVVLMMALVGFTPSIIRAGITMLIYLLGVAVVQRSDGLSSLAVAVTVMLFVNPFYVMSVSFMLSVLSTAGIIIIAPRIKQHCPFKNRAVRKLWAAFAVTVSAQILTVPIVLTNFGTLSVFSIPTNIVLFYPLTLLLSLGMAAECISFWPLGASAVMLAAKAVARVCIAVFKTVGGSQMSSVRIAGDAMFLCISLLLLAAAAFTVCKSKRVRIAVSAVTAAAVVMLSTVGLAAQAVAVRLTAVDTDSGMCVVLSYRSHAVIIGSGADNNEAVTIDRTLDGLGVSRVDLLILPGDSPNIIGGANLLAKLCSPSEVICGDKNLLANQPPSGIIELENMTFNMWGVADISVSVGVGVSISAYGKTFLVAFDRRATSLGGADVLFTRLGDVNVSADKAVVCRVSHGLHEAGLLAGRGIDSMYTGGRGSITVSVYGNDKIYFRRERDGFDN